MSDRFVHLHLHSEYSLLDGACRIRQAVKTAKALEQPALAITDHGVMSGVVEFTKACKKAGIKPIVGQEFYLAPKSRFDRVYQVDNRPFHLVLLAKNQEGYENLCRLSSEGWLSGFYGKPRIDKALLAAHSKGLIGLSACLAGELPRLIAQGQFDLAVKTAKEYAALFEPGCFFVELQHHGMEEERAILPQMLQLVQQTGLPPVITNDAHYCQKEDAKAQHVLMCISTGRTLGEAGGLSFDTDEFYLKSRSQMQAAFAGYPEEMIVQGLDNTLKIAEMCDFDFAFGSLKPPEYQPAAGQNKRSLLEKLCQEGIKKRYGQTPPPEALERMQEELEIITQMGFLDYFLIVWDFVQYAKTHEIPVGPGRGSGAGCFVSYLIGITDVDPLKYGLLFERFLNPQRITMPDFDIDFCYEKRQQVIDYVIDTYGADRVCQIVTFGTLAARAAIRDVGRVMGVGYGLCDKVAKQIPRALDITIDRALELVPELAAAYENEPETKKLINTARSLEGMPRHASTHAAGVVVTPKAAVGFLPLQKNDDAVVTQFTKETVEELGLMKIDFLGLRTLTVMEKTKQAIQAGGRPDFEIDSIQDGDQDTYAMLTKGQSAGVFQLESAGMRQLLTQLKPTRLEDLIAAVSLYRPGPMDSIPAFLKNRKAPQKITYLHPLLEPILKDTFGVIVYQEQVMQICRQLAGFSLGQSDLVRRAMAKKKADVMEAERNHFIYGGQTQKGQTIPGCVAKGIDPAVAGKIFDEMSSFAAYAFNKSHATGYALVAYRAAWLKCHYPKEFMASMLTVYLGDTGKMIADINECKRLGIPLLPPDVNTSLVGFSVQAVPTAPQKRGIRFGLLAVKNVGRSLLEQLITERQKHGPFVDFYDFCARMGDKELNARTLESLIRAGALDTLGANRCQMINLADELMGAFAKERTTRATGQISLFDTDPELMPMQPAALPALAEYPKEQLLAMEKEMTGLYLSGHPLDDFKPLAHRLNPPLFEDLLQAQETPEDASTFSDGARVCLLGLITARRNRVTKSGDRMSTLILEDWTATLEGMIYPKQFARLDALAKEGSVRLICGRLKAKEEEPVSLSVEELFLPDEGGLKSAMAWAKKGRLAQGQATASASVATRSQTPFASKKEPIGQLFCRLPDPTHYDRIAMPIFEHPGQVQLALFYESENKEGQKHYDYQPESLWVDGSNELIQQLQQILGEKNVVLRLKK